MSSQKGFLLDTNVLSEGSKRLPAAEYLKWLETVDDTLLYTSCLVIGEGLRGVLTAKDPVKRARLEIYWQSVTETFSGKSLPIDAEVCTIWAKLSAKASQRGHTAPYVDSLLAAQALHYNLTLVTRNVKDFEQFKDLAILSPWT